MERKLEVTPLPIYLAIKQYKKILLYNIIRCKMITKLI